MTAEQDQLYRDVQAEWETVKRAILGAYWERPKAKGDASWKIWIWNQQTVVVSGWPGILLRELTLSLCIRRKTEGERDGKNGI